MIPVERLARLIELFQTGPISRRRLLQRGAEVGGSASLFRVILDRGGAAASPGEPPGATPSQRFTTGIGPYDVPAPIDTDPSTSVLETVIKATHGMVDLGGGLMAHAERLNGAIPGPTLRLNLDDTVIVRLINELDHPTGIHWHGIELANSADGTEVTQNGVTTRFAAAPPSPTPAGGTYLYKFTAPRPGIYWYHPHHHHATNRVFRGMYGMIVVADPNEAALIASGVIPAAADTKQLVLSDITVCKTPGANDAATYVDPTTLPVPDRAEWLSGATAQPAPTPRTLCEIAPLGSATTEDGTPAATAYAAGEVPSVMRSITERINEGQTVLTNGVKVGGRRGTPVAPGALDPGAQTLDVLAGQGLRLQIANCATIRYFRLILTTSTGSQVPLVRIGGEGGLLDNAVVEGGVISGYDTKSIAGEIVLPPGSRADVVAAIPPTATGVLTLWTRDFQRSGSSFSSIPTVPVMHLNVIGTAATTYTIATGTPLRASIPGASVETLGAPTGVLLDPLDPASFTPTKPGLSTQDIQITNPPSIDGIVGSFDGFTPYTSAPHIDSSRYAEPDETLQLSVTNQTSNHHPFHLHGFSMQPISLTQLGAPGFTWPYREFRDNIDVPSGYTLTFRVRLDDRALLDGVTPGGAWGRWLFHCHIFHHHHQGMLSELVVTAADGGEKPNVDVNGSWAYTPVGGIATRTGTFQHPDGDPVTLTASLGTVMPSGPDTWSWSLDSTGMTPQTHYVYITGTDPAGHQDQAVFRLKIGAPDDGADHGDPHIRTVDGTLYDFQAVGEFTLLRDSDDLDVQVRQWPVTTANPITDGYSGITSCVSLTVAVAARVGRHTISYQPGRERKRLEFYLDGKRASLPTEGLDLDGHRVSTFDAAGETGLRIDYLSGAIVTVTPMFWSAYGVWYMNTNIGQTQADEGIMGAIASGSWLPRLSDGRSLGPIPSSLSDRYDALYRTYADSWRVDDATSLFFYQSGESTKRFTDPTWPGEASQCNVEPPFEIPGAPVLEGMPVERAEKLCASVTEKDLHQFCVFDVAATGDEIFAKHYQITQELRPQVTAVQIVADNVSTQPGERLTVTAIVLPLGGKRVIPSGGVAFFVDGKSAGRTVRLDKSGRARFTTAPLKRGTHRIRAAYTGSGDQAHQASSSPFLIHTVGDIAEATPDARSHQAHG